MLISFEIQIPYNVANVYYMMKPMVLQNERVMCIKGTRSVTMNIFRKKIFSF